MFFASDAYDRFMGRWSRRLAPLLIDFAHVGPRQVVLDVGSGTGALACAATAVTDVQVVGVDPVRQYVGSARQHANDQRLCFVLADALALPFADCTFDRALSLLVLNFVPDPGRAVSEMIRVTRAGGVVAGAVWDYGDSMGMLRTFWDEAAALDPDAPDERGMPLSRCGELAALWQAHRLVGVNEVRLCIDMPFLSFDDYWQAFLGGQGPAGAYAASLPRRQRTALRARLHDRLAPSGAAFSLRGCAWAVRGEVTAPAAAR
jgi:SAM-dependent methyltransferase